MRNKIRNKKGVTLTEVIITLVVSSIFFVIVGTVVFTYRDVTNQAISQTATTSQITLVGSAFDKLSNYCNSSENNTLYYSEKGSNGDFVMYVFNQEKAHEDVSPSNISNFKVLTYNASEKILRYSNEETGLELKVDTKNLGDIDFSVSPSTKHQIMIVNITDVDGNLVAQRSYRFLSGCIIAPSA